MINWELRSINATDTERIGEALGNLIIPPAVIELRSDLGGGKTTFTKGLVHGLGSAERVASPTFTLNKVYKTSSSMVHHFDFYRLTEPGVLRDQLQESLDNPDVVTVVEWSDIVKDVLPKDRIIVEFLSVADNLDERIIRFTYQEPKVPLIEKLRTLLTELKP